MPAASQIRAPSPRVMIGGVMFSPCRAKCPQRYRAAFDSRFALRASLTAVISPSYSDFGLPGRRATHSIVTQTGLDPDSSDEYLTVEQAMSDVTAVARKPWHRTVFARG